LQSFSELNKTQKKEIADSFEISSGLLKTTNWGKRPVFEGITIYKEGTKLFEDGFNFHESPAGSGHFKVNVFVPDIGPNMIGMKEEFLKNLWVPISFDTKKSLLNFEKGKKSPAIKISFDLDKALLDKGEHPITNSKVLISYFQCTEQYDQNSYDEIAWNTEQNRRFYDLVKETSFKSFLHPAEPESEKPNARQFVTHLLYLADSAFSDWAEEKNLPIFRQVKIEGKTKDIYYDASKKNGKHDHTFIKKSINTIMGFANGLVLNMRLSRYYKSFTPAEVSNILERTNLILGVNNGALGKFGALKKDFSQGTSPFNEEEIYCTAFRNNFMRKCGLLDYNCDAGEFLKLQSKNKYIKDKLAKNEHPFMLHAFPKFTIREYTKSNHTNLTFKGLHEDNIYGLASIPQMTLQEFRKNMGRHILVNSNNHRQINETADKNLVLENITPTKISFLEAPLPLISNNMPPSPSIPDIYISLPEHLCTHNDDMTPKDRVHDLISKYSLTLEKQITYKQAGTSLLQMRLSHPGTASDGHTKNHFYVSVEENLPLKHLEDKGYEGIFNKVCEFAGHILDARTATARNVGSHTASLNEPDIKNSTLKE